MSAVATGAEGPFNRRTVFWGIFASLFAAAGFFLLATYAPDFRVGTSGGASALSKSGTGFAGLARLLALTGNAPILVRDVEALENEALLIVTIPANADLAALDRIIKARQDRTTLFVLPKWLTIPLQAHEGWEMSFGRLPTERVDPLLKRIATLSLGSDQIHGDKVVLAGRTVTVPPEAQWILAMPALISAGPKNGILVKGKDNAHFVLSDPDFMDNAALKDEDKAAAAVALISALRPNDQTIMFDLTLHGVGRSHDLAKLLVEPPFLALTLTILAAAALALLHGLVRFGPPVAEARAIPFGKRALVTTTARLLRRAGRLGGLGGRYAALMRGRAAELLGAPQGLRGDDLERWLDSRDRNAPDGFTRRAEAARRARNEREMQLAARRLHDWIARRQGEHR
jgi:hypothetical protein